MKRKLLRKVERFVGGKLSEARANIDEHFNSSEEPGLFIIEFCGIEPVVLSLLSLEAMKGYKCDIAGSRVIIREVRFGFFLKCFFCLMRVLVAVPEARA